MKYGEIITLGRHKLMCGDATSREDVMGLVDGVKLDLVLTDPPYGIRSVNPNSKTVGGGIITHFKGQVVKKITCKKYPPVIGDTDTYMFRESWQILRTICTRHVIWGGQNFTDMLPPTCGWIFWDKCRSEGLTFSDGELVWSNISTKVKKYSHKWNGLTRAGSRVFNEKVHPNQKPVELHMKILEDFTKPDDVILDCFGGSGTTLIACEMTGRKCLMMEISPEYCDIIRERYEKLKDFTPLFNSGRTEKSCPQ